MSDLEAEVEENENKGESLSYKIVRMFELLHIRESCTDPGQETSTLVNFSCALQVT
ncbi:hypothetical protein C0J52_26651 [Blattella germanica]|nr:hypothetical protein C0J52_26651 [Blattella germanica]